MTSSVSKKVGIPKQRGFWLRCFLSAAFWICLCLAGAASSVRKSIFPLRSG